ncbi:putative uncharacterized transposon-derived like protein [Argiope bruennichi]|uniref:Uncharacterized transposon-derived like protein n=1 Tax=Argiope bruennichi TaxID=94029 RepID=A0A8T0G2L7_ARGBR|nr:putative uncharacterized transposon-derived like protein [Argiope bruennichi]
MPFGLANAPYFFSKVMSQVLENCESFAVPCLDDIAIYSQNWEDHLKHIEKVLKRVGDANLTIKPSKCKFVQSHTKYLGHIVGRGVRTPAEASIKAALDFPTPTRKTLIRAFPGLAGYYAHYVKDFSTDASDIGIRIVISQSDSKGEENPILSIDDNPFACNCSIKWLQKLAKAKKRILGTSWDQITCNDPEIPTSVALLINVTIPNCELPKVHIKHKKVIMNESQSADLFCSATGDPPLSLFWNTTALASIHTVEDLEIQGTIDYDNESPDMFHNFSFNSTKKIKVLKIFAAKRDDNVNLYCIAENDVGQEIAQVPLEIHSIPKIIEIEGSKNGHCCINYLVTGFPKPDRKWYFNNLLLRNPMILDLENSKTMENSYLTDGCLQCEITAQMEEGLFTLVASNVYGTVNQSIDAKFSKAYENPEHPGSFGGVEALFKATNGAYRRQEIKNWLSKKESYTLHKAIRKKFKKNKVLVNQMNQQFQADLVDMRSLSEFNDGYNYLLTCICILSKYAWAIPLKGKASKTIISAFKMIFSERTPLKLQTDRGKEFVNKLFQNYLKRMKIKFFVTNNNTKASVVERFNRTLKTKMWKYFTEKNTKRYIDVIDKLIFSYNNTWHRSIRMTPASVSFENQGQAWKNLYADQKIKLMKPKFKVGDTVRISKEKLLFEKGYEQNWTIEIFTVDRVLLRNPVVYKIKDLNGEEIEGTFYEQELQKVIDSGFYPVEKILKTRTRKGQLEYFVKFRGYPEKFNTWLPTPITIDGGWEVGLVDLIYPHTWYNIRSNNNLFGFDLGDGKSIARRIPSGCYETIPDILNGMYLESFKNKIEMTYHPVIKRVRIKTKGGAKVILHKGISELLGFEPGELGGNVESPFIADPSAAFPVIYVYCDLVESQIVGDVQAPLLKIVKVEGKDGEVVNAHFVRPHYVPVLRQHFQTIEMSLRLHSGELVPFERGRVIVVLHFRMRQLV